MAMAQRTIARMYNRYQDAQMVVHDLEVAGIPATEVSIISNSERDGDRAVWTGTGSGTSTTSGPDPNASSGAGAGATAGAVIGGGLGLAAGLGALAIPGIGPVVAAGWLVATLAGAGVGGAAGGLVGALTAAGVSHEEADVYAEGLRSGGTLVTVRTDDAHMARVEDIMGRHNSLDWREQRAAYGDTWAGFDETRVTPVSPVDDARRRSALAEESARAMPSRGGGTPPAATPPNVRDPL